jgi:hypothetical protein
MDNAVLIEIESLRRASLAGLREKFREYFRKKPAPGTGNTCSATPAPGSPRRIRGGE